MPRSPGDGRLMSPISGTVMLEVVGLPLSRRSEYGPNLPLAAGSVLLVGCLGVLFANVMKAEHPWSLLR